MPYYQELCRVRISWLEPGDVCLESKLGTSEYSECNVIARVQGQPERVYQGLGREEMLALMLGRESHPFVDGSHWALNPPVRLLVPVTLYEFDVTAAGEGRLASQAMEEGIEPLFAEHLPELRNIGYWLWNQGRHSDRGPWGIQVCFHALWVFQPTANPGKAEFHRHFAGYVDLTRMPFSMFSESPAPQPRPQRKPARTCEPPLHPA